MAERIQRMTREDMERAAQSPEVQAIARKLWADIENADPGECRYPSCQFIGCVQQCKEDSQ